MRKIVFNGFNQLPFIIFSYYIAAVSLISTKRFPVSCFLIKYVPRCLFSRSTVYYHYNNAIDQTSYNAVLFF